MVIDCYSPFQPQQLLTYIDVAIGCEITAKTCTSLGIEKAGLGRRHDEVNCQVHSELPLQTSFDAFEVVVQPGSLRMECGHSDFSDLVNEIRLAWTLIQLSALSSYHSSNNLLTLDFLQSVVTSRKRGRINCHSVTRTQPPRMDANCCQLDIRLHWETVDTQACQQSTMSYIMWQKVPLLYYIRCVTHS